MIKIIEGENRYAAFCVRNGKIVAFEKSNSREYLEEITQDEEKWLSSLPEIDLEQE